MGFAIDGGAQLKAGISADVKQSAATEQPDPAKAAERVLDAGDRFIIKYDYEKRMDVFAEEMSKGGPEYRAQLIHEILKRDSGAFDSWLKSDRVNTLEREGRITSGEADAIYEGFRERVAQGGEVSTGFVKSSHDPKLIADYMKSQNMTTSNGIKNAVSAFAGVDAKDMKQFINDPANAALMRTFKLEVQQHQREYEQLTTGILNPNNIFSPYDAPPVQFNRDQLTAMRDAFKSDDKMFTNGELLLAYPDRIERNEQVTRHYYELSNGMSDILGKDNANWATFAVWASDEIGRNLDSSTNRAVEQAGLGDPRFWLSQGNSKLVSDIGPGFRHFVDTFGEGKNRNMTFDQFWKGFESKYAGRGISYLPGGKDKPDDMKNAFKAYYDAMKIQDQLKSGNVDGSRVASLQSRQEKLMLYANTLVGLQEQSLVQTDISEGLKVLGGTNPLGAGAPFVDLHVPGANGKGEKRLDTDVDLTTQSTRVNSLNETFVTADGKTINLDTALRTRLEGLDGNSTNEQEWNIANSGTSHWESYSQRMGYIFHLFEQYQHDKALFNDPRTQFGTRAQQLDTEPEPWQVPYMGR